jgi:hypothetical protein
MYLVYFKTEISVQYLKIGCYESKCGDVRILRSKLENN